MLHETHFSGDGASGIGQRAEGLRDGWPASLELSIVSRGDESVLAHCLHHGPLRVQRPFYPEGPEVCHICLLHPPGGLVPGDRLEVDVRVGDGGRALVTTPAAAKIYRSDGRLAVQRQRLSVGRGAALEWLPQETIVFDGALWDMETTVSLEEGAVLVAWEIQCLGRPAMGERFTHGACKSRLEIARAGELLYLDATAWEGGSEVLRGAYGLAGESAFGTLVVVGAPAGSLEIAREVIGGTPPSDGVSATLLAGGELLCCRYLGASASRGRERFSSIWAALRPRLIGRRAVPPRVWST